MRSRNAREDFNDAKAVREGNRWRATRVDVLECNRRHRREGRTPDWVLFRGMIVKTCYHEIPRHKRRSA